ncbi:glycoside hydrolase family 2, partial [Flavobacterium circumlabens]
GVFKNSEVWINGHSLGMRPNGYISFAYDLSKYLNFGKENTIAVKVDNDAQPNSRWYTGSGIYRNVKVTASGKLHIGLWGTFVTTPEITKEKVSVQIEIEVKNDFDTGKEFRLVTSIVDQKHGEVAKIETKEKAAGNAIFKKVQHLSLPNPILWSIENPYLYKVVTKIFDGKTMTDQYETPLGIRYFNFN